MSLLRITLFIALPACLWGFVVFMFALPMPVGVLGGALIGCISGLLAVST